MAQFGGVFAVVASDADNLRRPCDRQKSGVFQADRFDPAGSQAFDVAAGLFRRRKQNPYNRLSSGNGLDQAVVGLSVLLKAAVFNRNLSKHERWMCR